jgi:hypothetical protein
MGAGLNYPSWGMSWVGSWGQSWGQYEVEENPRGGGIGHGKEGKTKGQKRVVVEKDGKLLLFRNAHDAAAFISLDKPKEVKLGIKAKQKKTQVKPVEVIDLKVVEKYQQQLVEFVPEVRYEKLINLSIEVLLRIASKLRELEDDDIEFLLMAA